MNTIHPYLRYAQALILAENNLKNKEDITSTLLITEIEKGLNVFRVKPQGSFKGQSSVKFGFEKIETGDVDNGIFLSPNVLSTDKAAKYIWIESHSVINELQNSSLDKIGDLKMSIAPISGEYLSFSLQKSIGRGKPKASLYEQGLCAITALTNLKPCLQYRIDRKGKTELFNICLIPNLSIDKLVDFILFFKRMRGDASADLMIGNVLYKETGKGDNKKVSYEPKRPLIYKGNFPNPPRSSALGSIALLGAIGEFSKNGDYSEQAKRVLEDLKDTEMYLIKYGGANVFTYNHHIIDLAKEGKLKILIDSLYYSTLYNQDRRSSINSEYQKFDLFTSRFLLLFNQASFKDFLAFRAEYPNPTKLLLNTYFIKMENIEPKIVSSARILGHWLNYVAYLTAKSEVKGGTANYWEELRRVKSKVLIELESSTFSAKSGDALIAQVITRAGRLSGQDAPEEATLFMEKTASGELALDNAKNLLIAFSRLKNKIEKKETDHNDETSDDENDSDLSNV